MGVFRNIAKPEPDTSKRWKALCQIKKDVNRLSKNTHFKPQLPINGCMWERVLVHCSYLQATGRNYTGPYNSLD